MKQPIRIAIAEDHLLFRQGMLSLLKDYDNIHVLFHVSNGLEAMNELKKAKPDILLLDLDMPVMPGKIVIEKVKVKYPSIKIIIVSQYFFEPFITDFVKMGVSAFLPKDFDFEKTIDAIYSVYETGFYFENRASAAMARTISLGDSFTPHVTLPGIYITERELEILRLVKLGYSSKEISEQLNIAAKTVDNHKAALMKKTGTKSSLALAAYATKNNIV